MRVRFVLFVLLLATTLPVAGARAADPPACDPATAETGLQGEVPLADQLSGRAADGYACNLRLVGAADLGGLTGDTQMTWYGECAYRVVSDGGSDGIAVIDVADPTAPTLVEVLRSDAWAGRGGPVLGIHEGVHANDERGILVVPVETMLSIYDVAEDCRHPRHLSDFAFERNANPTHDPAIGAAGIHSGQLSPDGTWYYATDIGNGAVAPTGPCLTIVDLADLEQPRVVQRWGADFPCHDLDLSPDGTRAYVGWYDADIGHPSAVVGAFTPAGQPAALLSGMRVVDVSALQHREVDPTTAELPIVGEINGGGNHTEVFTRIDGRDYVITAEEGHCPAGNGRIIDVTDETHPVEVGRLELEINSPAGCANALAGATGGNLLTYTSHYLAVDDEVDASLVFVSWYSSGLRVFDISDPTDPREIAYFNPGGDSTTTYPRYVPETGHVWVGSATHPFWVVELGADGSTLPEAAAVRAGARLRLHDQGVTDQLPVPREVVDLDVVAEWMDGERLGSGPIVDVELIGGGTQNVLLRFRRGDESRQYVLRRPPPHKRKNSDETMRREARMLAALKGSDVPHPELIAACPAEDVIGASFYLMEPVDGFNATLGVPEAYRSDPAMQRSVGLSMADGIAALGRVDHVAAGVADLGKGDGWLERQVDRWRGQLESYRDFDGYDGPDIPGVEAVASWLDANRPATWSAGVIHGDYHFANVLLRHDVGALAAIVDWELTTIGDPLLDLGHLLVTWPDPGGGASSTVGVDMPGLPRKDEVIARYAEGSTRDVSGIGWYEVLACYRLGSILEGTNARADAGLAPRETGDLLHAMTLGLFQQAQRRIAAEESGS